MPPAAKAGLSSRGNPLWADFDDSDDEECMPYPAGPTPAEPAVQAGPHGKRLRRGPPPRKAKDYIVGCRVHADKLTGIGCSSGLMALLNGLPKPVAEWAERIFNTCLGNREVARFGTVDLGRCHGKVSALYVPLKPATRPRCTDYLFMIVEGPPARLAYELRNKSLLVPVRGRADGSTVPLNGVRHQLKQVMSRKPRIGVFSDEVTCLLQATA